MRMSKGARARAEKVGRRLSSPGETVGSQRVWVAVTQEPSRALKRIIERDMTRPAGWFR